MVGFGLWRGWLARALGWDGWGKTRGDGWVWAREGMVGLGDEMVGLGLGEGDG